MAFVRSLEEIQPKPTLTRRHGSRFRRSKGPRARQHDHTQRSGQKDRATAAFSRRRKKTRLGHRKRPRNRRRVAGRRRVPGSRALRRRCCGRRGRPPQQPKIVGTAVIDANSPASVSLRALSASPRSKYVRRDDVRRRAPSAVHWWTLRNARSSRCSRARRGRRSRRPTSTGLHCGAHGLVSRRVRLPARRYAAHALSGRSPSGLRSLVNRDGRVRAHGPSQKPPLAADPPARGYGSR